MSAQTVAAQLELNLYWHAHAANTITCPSVAYTTTAMLHVQVTLDGVQFSSDTATFFNMAPVINSVSPQSSPFAGGGLVSVGTVCEQMLYEIGDPQAYILPDVTCDFSTAVVEQLGENRVRVSGATGRPAPDSGDQRQA